MRRRYGLIFSLLLSGCSGEDDGSPAAQPPAYGAAPAQAESRVACALDGAQRLSQGCSLEQARVDGKSYLVVRRPDGGFRRFVVLSDGTVAEADGAEPAAVTRSGDTVEIAVGQDRYSLTPQQVTNAR